MENDPSASGPAAPLEALPGEPYGRPPSGLDESWESVRRIVGPDGVADGSASDAPSDGHEVAGADSAAVPGPGVRPDLDPDPYGSLYRSGSSAAQPADARRSAYPDDPARDYEGTKIISREEQAVHHLTVEADRILDSDREDRSGWLVEEPRSAGFQQPQLAQGEEVVRVTYSRSGERTAHIRDANGNERTDVMKTERSPRISIRDIELDDGDVVEKVAFSPTTHERIARIRMADGSLYYRRDSPWEGQRTDEYGRVAAYTRGSDVTAWQPGDDSVATTKATWQVRLAAATADTPPHPTYGPVSENGLNVIQDTYTSLRDAFPRPPHPIDHYEAEKRRNTRTQRFLGRVGFNG